MTVLKPTIFSVLKLGLEQRIYSRDWSTYIIFPYNQITISLNIVAFLARCPLPSAVGSELGVQLGNPHSYLPRALLGLASQRNDDDSDKKQWPRFHLIFMDFYQLGTGYLSFAFIFCWNFSPNRSSLHDDALLYRSGSTHFLNSPIENWMLIAAGDTREWH